MGCAATIHNQSLYRPQSPRLLVPQFATQTFGHVQHEECPNPLISIVAAGGLNAQRRCTEAITVKAARSW